MGRTASRGAEPEVVHAWRPGGLPGVIAMDGVVSSHAAEPRGEYMIGVIGRRPMRLQRGGTGHVLGPGSLAVLDPFLPHRGAPAAGGPWRCLLLIMELPDVTALVGDPDLGRQAPPVFREPVLRDRGLARGFVALHRLLAAPASLLERQSALAAWWGEAARWSAAAPGRHARARGAEAAAVRRALSLVADSPAADVSLADLAAAAGLSQYRLVEAFRQRFGTTPHAFQVAQRVNRSRRLLEAGVPAAEAAVRAGFLRPEPSAPALPPPAGPDPAAYTAAFGHRHHDFVQEPSGGRALTSDS